MPRAESQGPEEDVIREQAWSLGPFFDHNLDSAAVASVYVSTGQLLSLVELAELPLDPRLRSGYCGHIS